MVYMNLMESEMLFVYGTSMPMYKEVMNDVETAIPTLAEIP
jgi:hypothetical protein